MMINASWLVIISIRTHDKVLIPYFCAHITIRMSKELKIGIITLITLAVMIWGFQYMKGKNLLKKGYTFTAVYNDVEGLSVASPVQINGLAVGAISSITVNPDDVRSMVVTFDVEGDFKLPKSTVALNAAPPSVIGSRKIVLKFDHLCSGDDCLESGARLKSSVRGIVASLVGGDEVDGIISGMRQNLGPLMDTVIQRITSTDNENSIGQSLQNLDEVTQNLSALTANLNKLLRASTGSITTTMENLAVVSGSFAKTNKDLENMIVNLSAFSSDIVEADLGGTLAKTGETLDSTNDLLTGLKTTVNEANSSFSSVSSMLQKVDTGQGTIGRLLNDPEIYHNLESTTEHLALLLQDMRLNPKRYVRLSVFGRKGNAYTAPEDDPAMGTIKPKDNKEN